MVVMEQKESRLFLFLAISSACKALLILKHRDYLLKGAL
jgi:hypothetical protein